MGKCAKHPERETNMVCMKDNIYMCGECLGCRNPEIHCKYRTSCPIWFTRKGEESWDDGEKEEKAAE